MKKLLILSMALASFVTLKAQWADDPVNNNHIANCSSDAGEVYTSTVPSTGDTYIQWCAFGSNGWSPFLQRLTYDGTPQWGNSGIHISGHQFSSMSEGLAMTATSDGCVVSCFANYDGNTYAVKIDPDGNFVWGEQGLQLFGGLGFSRAELTAGNDGGFWALGFDYTNLYLQYIGADGSMGPTTTISDNGGYKCMFGQLSLSVDNNVLLTYEKVGSGFYTDKELYVVGVTPLGDLISPTELLMSSQTFQSTYIHHAVPDGMGGGYAYIWHPGIGEAFNTYVFHFNELGLSTINDLNGIPVHSTDPSNFYTGAYGTVDPISHDLIIAYEQTDASTQSQSRIYMNRITSTGERLWGEGILIADNGPDPYSDILVDAFEDGSGFSVIYSKGTYNCTIEAKGYDMDGNLIWSTTMSSNSYSRAACENSTAFHLGQNVVAWVNSANGGVYGQNIGPDGTMGKLTPIPSQCPGPENFQGEYVHDTNTDLFGVALSWTPVEEPDYYILYRTDVNTGEENTTEIEGTATSYFDETGIGQFTYQLRGASEACGLTLPATTPEGENYVYIEVTGIEENSLDEIISVTRIYTMNGQVLKCNDTEELSNGIYILQGLTKDGKLVSQKVVVNH